MITWLRISKHGSTEYLSASPQLDKVKLISQIANEVIVITTISRQSSQYMDREKTIRHCVEEIPAQKQSFKQRTIREI